MSGIGSHAPCTRHLIQHIASCDSSGCVQPLQAYALLSIEFWLHIDGGLE